MKRTWKFITIGMLVTGLLVSGCASPAALTRPSGLSTQQLHNVAHPSSSSWLPKFMQPGPAQPKFNGGGNLSELSTAATPAAKNTKPKKVDPLAMARLNERRGQFENAVKIYERELATSPRKAFIHHRLAVIAAREGRWDKSRDHFTEACRLEPRNSEILGDLGYALYLQHQLPEAEECLQAAVEANPQNKAAQNNLGIVLGVQGKYDQSLAAFRRAVPDAEAHANLGYVHMQLGDGEKAMNELNQALSLDSSLKTAAVALVQLNDLKHRLKPKDLDGMMLAKKQAKPAGPSAAPSSIPNQEPAPETPAAFANAMQVAAAPASVPPAARATQDFAQPPQAEQTAEPSVSQRLLTGYAASELKPRETQVAATPAPLDTRIREIPERLPAPSSHVSLSGLGSKPTASASLASNASPSTTPKPAQLVASAAITTQKVALPTATRETESEVARQIATLANPADSVVQASAQVNMAPPLLKAPVELTDHSVADQRNATSQPVPVFKPSLRIQQLRQHDQAQAELRTNSGTRLESTSTSLESDRITLNGEDVANAGNSAPHSDLATAVKAAHIANSKTSVVNPTTGATPSMVPQVAMPRPEDMIPAHAQMNQLPTHQLHPTASPTWTAPSTVSAAQPGSAATQSKPAAVKSPLPRVKVMPN